MAPDAGAGGAVDSVRLRLRGRAWAFSRSCCPADLGAAPDHRPGLARPGRHTCRRCHRRCASRARLGQIPLCHRSSSPDNGPVDGSLPNEIQARLSAAGASADAGQIDSLVRYFGLLTKWNRTVNLTSLKLDPPSPESLDRLLVEPFLAAERVRQALPNTTAGRPLSLLDVGSGGGSPAVPLRIALGPQVQLHMVESRGKKAAFLREALRELDFKDAEVHNARLGELLGDSGLLGSFQLAAIRAVRADRELWRALAALVQAQGFVLWFRTAEDAGNPDSVFFPEFLLSAVHPLIPVAGSELAVLRRV